MPPKFSHAGGANANGHIHTITALSRWSILSDKQLPSTDSISSIHIYDFDNTLFQTPLPNPKLWNSQTLGQLGSPDIFVNGGWWHDSRILAATGDGAESEERKAWDGWWNDKVVELVRLTMQQEGALCVLLTGRSELGFSDLLKRIVASKGLEFDMIGLKPAAGPNNERFRSTMQFKQAFLEATMETYRHAQDIRLYEDRPKHVAGFRAFFSEYNQRQLANRTRGPITFEVVEVADISTNLDPVVEVAEIQHLVNNHNALVGQGKHARRDRLTIRKNVFFTSYMIDPEDTKRLLSLVALPNHRPDELRVHANQIMISPRACPQDVLTKVGGINAKLKWQVTHTGSLENSVWAAALQPVPVTAAYHTENPFPYVVLALRKGARPADGGNIQNWQPVSPDKAFVFETTVGEKVMLRIEPEGGGHDANKNNKRKYPGNNEEGRPRGGFHNSSRGNAQYNGHAGRGNRGGRGGNAPNRGFRNGSSRGGGFKGQGRGGGGGRGGYKSLDDVAARGGQDGYGSVSYDDSFPSLTSKAHKSGQNRQQGPSWSSQQGGQASKSHNGGGADLQSLY